MKRVFEIEMDSFGDICHMIYTSIAARYKIEIKVKELYPCNKCGKLRTKAEGGTTFTVCDQCWDKKELPQEGIIKELKYYSGTNSEVTSKINELIKKVNSL